MPPSSRRPPPSHANWSPTVTVVIPALNEEHNLPLVLENLPPVDEVIVVDGRSDDDTVAVAREVRPDAIVVRQTRVGKGNALACGFAAATSDIVVTLNADGTADPGEIPRFVDALLSGAEAAHGSRFRYGGDHRDALPAERLGHSTLSHVVNMLFRTRFTDLSCGYNAYWRELLPVLDLPAPLIPGLKRGRPAWGDGPEVETLITVRMATRGLRVVEVATVGYPRIHGDRPRRTMPAVLRALRTVTTEYALRWSRAPRRTVIRQPALPDSQILRPRSAPPSLGRPISGAPSFGRPTSGAPSFGRPTSGAPSFGRPVSGAPSSSRQISGAPAFGQPISGAPSFGQPVSGAPASGRRRSAPAVPGQAAAWPERPWSAPPSSGRPTSAVPVPGRAGEGRSDGGRSGESRGGEGFEVPEFETFTPAGEESSGRHAVAPPPRSRRRADLRVIQGEGRDSRDDDRPQWRASS